MTIEINEANEPDKAAKPMEPMRPQQHTNNITPRVKPTEAHSDQNGIHETNATPQTREATKCTKLLEDMRRQMGSY